MPIHFQKSLQECLPKIKKPTSRIGLPPPPRNFPSATARWILRGCKHPKTLSFACDDQKQNEENEEGGGGAGGGGDGDDAATLSDIDRFLMENFKSLYNKKDDDDDGEKSSSSSSSEEEAAGRVFMDPPKERNINGSHRFFVAPAAGSSSSSLIMEEARTSRLTIPCTTRSTSEDMTRAGAGFGSGSSFFGFDFVAAINSGYTSTQTSNNESERTSSYSAEEVLSADDFITVLTYSNTPYDDFKKSMQEMIEARLKHNGKIDWEFMEELLFCFLNLNDKKSYRFILRAFVDMIVFLRTQNQNQNNRLCKSTECSSIH